jgi:hypothetical protein
MPCQTALNQSDLRLSAGIRGSPRRRKKYPLTRKFVKKISFFLNRKRSVPQNMVNKSLTNAQIFAYLDALGL